MIGKKVICIDAGDKNWCVRHGMFPLEFMATYSIRGVESFGKGEGYLLDEIHNPCNVTEAPGKEPSYGKHRFVFIEDKEELVLNNIELEEANH